MDEQWSLAFDKAALLSTLRISSGWFTNSSAEVQKNKCYLANAATLPQGKLWGCEEDGLTRFGRTFKHPGALMAELQPHPCPAASEKNLRAHWRQLCAAIGERRAGGAGELRAARYIAARLADSGLEARIERFPCLTLVSGASEVAARDGNRWSRCSSQCLVGSASTPAGQPIEGEIAWLDFPEAAHRLRPGSLRGKIALLFGALPDEPDSHRRLLASAPAAVLCVDDRLPFSWHKGDALFPHWVSRFGSLPVLSVPYQAAWRWRARGLTRARVAAAARHARALSSNAVGTLPGTDPRLPGLLFCAHHDTQPGTIGADDNASGVVFLLEAARLLAGGPPLLRTIQFVSFGAEEQLSVGSARYVGRHRRQLGRVGLVINLDSVSSPLGHTSLFHSGHARLAPFFQRALRRGGCDVGIDDTVCPYADHFPFAALGVPAIWLYRWNVRGGHRWQHHGPKDSLTNVSAGQVAGLLDALLPPALRLANAPVWPFGKAVPAAVRARTRGLARTYFGMRL